MKGRDEKDCPLHILGDKFKDAPNSLSNMLAVVRLAACAIAQNPRVQAEVGLILANEFGLDVSCWWQQMMHEYTCCDSEEAYKQAVKLIEETTGEEVPDGYKNLR